MAPILVIYTHPPTTPKGNCRAIRETLEAELTERGLQYELIDLYAEHFDPVMRADEHYVSGGTVVHEDVAYYQERIRAAQYLIFIAPVWWGGVPAMLKGFFDRVLRPGFGFEYVSGVPRKLFTDKKALVFLTSGGPWWWTRVVQAGRPQRNIKWDILRFLGVRVRVLTHYKARRLTDARCRTIDALVHKGVRSLFGAR